MLLLRDFSGTGRGGQLDGDRPTACRADGIALAWFGLAGARCRGGVACRIVTSDSGSDDVTAQMLTVDARRVVLVITGLYLLAFLALLPFWGWLGRHDHRVWLWTALAGTVLGLLALPLIRKHTGEGRLG
jgi:hypothetical protein